MRQSIFIFAVLAVPFVIGPKFLVVCRIGSFLEYPSSCARNNYRDCTHPECKCPEGTYCCLDSLRCDNFCQNATSWRRISADCDY